jgi:hypothetical protein
MRRANTGEGGFVLITMLLLLALLAAMLATHFSLTWIELSTTGASMDSYVGFYAAEAGLNLRAEQVRQTFVGFSQPAGTSPDPDDACVGTNLGSGDFACADYKVQERDVVTYVRETTGSALPIVIPRGEVYGNLHGLENHYAVYSTATNVGRTEAVLEVHFMSRDVSLFQFAAFYDKDLEILPGTAMTIEGPVHSNGDLYLGSVAGLDLTHPVTTAGRMFRGRKDADACLAGSVRVNDPDDLTEIPTCSATRAEIEQADVSAWSMAINVDIVPLVVPPPAMLDAAPGSTYWDRADLRIVLDLDAAPAIEVRNADGSTDAAATAVLAGCGSAAYANAFYNHREGLTIKMLDLDVRDLLDCAHTAALMGGTGIDDDTDGGLVWYFGVEGPNSAVPNDYGVRLRNGADLTSTAVGAPAIEGLTIATDQALYVKGSYNSANKKPAALLADSFNVLSGASNDAASVPVATSTTIHAAVLAGTDSTGGAEGDAGQDGGGYNGGLENFFRLHEDWSAATLTYRGSIVSLFAPRHVDGAWASGSPQFLPPVRNWVYEDEFDDPELQPPLPPTFVYLKQELFVRRFEL